LANYKTGLETKQKIYLTAKQLFYEYGFIKTTLAEIAKESETNKAMVAYYFKNKNNLALEVYNEYMVANKVKTQKAIDEKFPGCNVVVKTAIEYRIQNRNCRLNRHLNQFYHELCDTNTLMKTESASVGFVENINWTAAVSIWQRWKFVCSFRAYDLIIVLSTNASKSPGG
jgi:AcrR family transcriptional regulator